MKEKTQIAYEMGYRATQSGEVIGLKGLVLATWPNSRGYIVFSCRFSGVARMVMVHSLVAYQKFGEDYLRLDRVARHKNGISSDNRWENILLGTEQENSMDRLPEERRKHAINAAKHRRRFSDEEVSEMRLMHESGLSYKEIGDIKGVGKSTLSYILSKKAKRTAKYEY